MIDNRNNFRLRFLNKETGAITYDDRCWFGSVHECIEKARTDLSSLCLMNVSNKTHRLIEVIWLMNNQVIWRNDNV